MESGEGVARSRPLHVKTVRGEPYLIGERRLVPVARVVSFGKARGTVGTDLVGGWGSGFSRITPLAILEETAEGERYVAITDGTAKAMQGLLTSAVVTTLLFAGIRWLARRLLVTQARG